MKLKLERITNKSNVAVCLYFFKDGKEYGYAEKIKEPFGILEELDALHTCLDGLIVKAKEL